MAAVKFIETTSANLSNLPVVNGQIIYVDGGIFGDDGITFGVNPYQQYLSTHGNVKLSVAYVSNDGPGYGTSKDSPSTLENVVGLILPDGIIYVVGDNHVVVNDFVLKGLNNVTIVNFNDGKTRTLKTNGKYLFILEDGSVVTMNNLTLEGGINVTNGSTLNIEDATITGAKEYGINTNGTVNGQCLKLS